MNTYKRRLKIRQLIEEGNSDIFKYLPSINDYFLCGNVRGGLSELIGLLFKDKPYKALLPVFVPEGIITPFRRKKISMIHYRLFTNLVPDIRDIEEKILKYPEIKCLVIIHYFGFPQDLMFLRELCTQNNVLLFEDCVHALFSKDEKGNYLGGVGDISFFSLPKILPVPDGGIFFY